MLHNISMLLALWFLAMGVVNAVKGRSLLALWCAMVFLVIGVVALST